MMSALFVFCLKVKLVISAFFIFCLIITLMIGAIYILSLNVRALYVRLIVTFVISALYFLFDCYVSDKRTPFSV